MKLISIPKAPAVGPGPATREIAMRVRFAVLAGIATVIGTV
jgi:hypothetical protein